KDSNFQEVIPRNTIHPLRELSVDPIFADLADIDKYYAKLRKHCFSVIKHCDSSLASHADCDQSSKFWSRCSPWLNAVLKVLKFTANLVHIVKNEATVALVEANDC